MNAIDKAVSSHITLGHLLDVLAVVPDAPLVFTYDSNPVRPGYHVTTAVSGILVAGLMSVAVAYVFMVIVTGRVFVSLQRKARKKWHERLYRFIPSGDYKELVLTRRSVLNSLSRSPASSVAGQSSPWRSLSFLISALIPPSPAVP